MILNMHRIFYILLVYVVVLINGFSQQSVYVLSNGNTLKDIKKLNGIIYCSLDEISKTFNLKVSDNFRLWKKTIIFEKGSATFSLNNSFVLLKSDSFYDKVYQMTSDTKFNNFDFIIPLSDFVKIYKLLTGITLTYQEIIQKPAIDTTKKIVVNKIFDVYKLEYSIKSNGVKLTFKTLKKIKSQNNRQMKDTLLIKLDDCTIDTNEISKIYAGGLFRKILSKQRDNDAIIRIELRFPIESKDITIDKNSVDVLFYLSPEVVEKVKKSEANNKKANNKEKFDVVVIDPGHGGKDPGAIGYRGTKEKDVNLSIALKLGNLIKQNLKDVKVEFTRDNDTFVELYRRGQIANEKKGDFFISIHANSTPRKPGDLSGAEIYLLRPGKTEDAIRIAEFENSVIRYEEDYEQRYKKMSEETHILTAITQTANVKHSEKFAEFLNDKFEKKLSIDNRGVKQAGFYVLVGASMPSVLIETGYLNNPEDERYLTSKEGQEEMANAIFLALLDYKKYFQDISD